MRIYLVITDKNTHRYFQNSKQADEFFAKNNGTAILPIDFNAKNLVTFLNKHQRG